MIYIHLGHKHFQMRQAYKELGRNGKNVQETTPVKSVNISYNI